MNQPKSSDHFVVSFHKMFHKTWRYRLPRAMHDAFFLATCLAMFEKKSIGSCRRDVIHCNFGLQLALQLATFNRYENRVELCFVKSL